MTCSQCKRRSRYMAADPEMYHGEDRRCDVHRPNNSSSQQMYKQEPPPGYSVGRGVRDGNPGDADAEYFIPRRDAVHLGRKYSMSEAVEACWKHMGFTSKEWVAMGLAIEVVKRHHKTICGCNDAADYICDACNVMDLIGA